MDVLLARNECFPNTPQDLSMLLMTEARLDEPNKEGKEGVFFERAPSNVDSTSTNTVVSYSPLPASLYSTCPRYLIR